MNLSRGAVFGLIKFFKRVIRRISLNPGVRVQQWLFMGLDLSVMIRMLSLILLFMRGNALLLLESQLKKQIKWEKSAFRTKV